MRDKIVRSAAVMVLMFSCFFFGVWKDLMIPSLILGQSMVFSEIAVLIIISNKYDS